MKRGLVALDRDPASAAQRALRFERLRARMRRAQVAVALIYGDVSRADDIAHLTGLCLYWGEAVLAVPLEGTPVLATTLSKRVHPWIQRTSTITDVRSGPSLAALADELIGEHAARRPVGLVDQAWWPAALVDAIARERGEHALVAMDDAVRDDRRCPDETLLAPLRDAGATLAAAVEAALATEQDPDAAIAGIERAARRAGFTDLLPAHASDRQTRAIDVVAQPSTLWLRVARASRTPTGSALDRALADAASRLRAGAAPIEVAAADGASSESAAVTVRVVRHVDLVDDAARRPLADALDPVRGGEVVALAAAPLGSRSGVVVCDTYFVAEGGAELLTDARRAS